MRPGDTPAAASRPSRAAWANTPAAVPRAPGAASEVGRARPGPIISLQCGQRVGCGGQAPRALDSTSRKQCGQYASVVSAGGAAVGSISTCGRQFRAQINPDGATGRKRGYTSDAQAARAWS